MKNLFAGFGLFVAMSLTLPLLALTVCVVRYFGILFLIPIGAAFLWKGRGVAVCEGSERTLPRRVCHET